MSRKLIGITCSSILQSAYGARDVLNRKYSHAVMEAGGVPLILPVFGGAEMAAHYLGAIDGLLLSGGVDVVPSEYGQEALPELDATDAGRDQLELPLIKLALEQNLPIFGICRGLQTLNIALGGTLYQDLPTQKPSGIQHSQSKLSVPRDAFTHTMLIEPNTHLASIVGAGEMKVNSHHHQAIDKLGKGLIVTALAPDGVIEAVEFPSKSFVVAVQSHPEETATHDERSRKLFAAFVAAL